MKKYLLVILTNIAILGIGVFLSFGNEKMDVASLENQCLIPLIDKVYYKDQSFNQSINELAICEDFIINIDELEVSIENYREDIDPDTTIVRFESSDKFLTIQSMIHIIPDLGELTDGYIGVIETTSYKYIGNHIPYDLIAFLIVILLNTTVYLLDDDYDKKYSFNTLFQSAGGVVVIVFLLTNQFRLMVPIFYYLSLIYIISLLVHYYYLYSTKQATFSFKLDDLEINKVYDVLEKNHIDLRVYRRVNFSGQYFTVRIHQDQADGLRKLLDGVLEENKRLYFYINVGLIGVINIGALIYLIRYFML